MVWKDHCILASSHWTNPVAGQLLQLSRLGSLASLEHPHGLHQPGHQRPLVDPATSRSNTIPIQDRLTHPEAKAEIEEKKLQEENRGLSSFARHREISLMQCKSFCQFLLRSLAKANSDSLAVDSKCPPLPCLPYSVLWEANGPGQGSGSKHNPDLKPTLTILWAGVADQLAQVIHGGRSIRWNDALLHGIESCGQHMRA